MKSLQGSVSRSATLMPPCVHASASQKPQAHNFVPIRTLSAPLKANRALQTGANSTVCRATVSADEKQFIEQPDLDIPANGFDSIQVALEALSRGEHVVVLDDEDRENEGDLIIPADKVTTQSMAFLINQTSGLVCVGMTAADLDRLKVPLMVNSAENEEAMYTAFTVSVDLRDNTSTGISAADRALTLRALADPTSKPVDFRRPGHIFPLKARDLGVLVRPGHTEAAVDLSRLAGCAPMGVLCELVNHADGSMQRTPELKEFSAKHGLKIITIADLIKYRLKHEVLVEHAGSAELPTRSGAFTAHSYRSLIDGEEHLVLVMGNVRGRSDVLVRVHTENVLSDVFASTRDDSCSQLEAAMESIAREGAGVLVYLRGANPMGQGLIRTSGGASTSAASTPAAAQGAAEDGARPFHPPYVAAIHALKHLGVQSMRLMTNSTSKFRSLSGYGIKIERRVEVDATCSVAPHPHANGSLPKLSKV